MVALDAVREKILNGPALAPPPGVVAGFDQPPALSRAALHGIAVMMFLLATFAVAIRTYTKAFMMKKLSIEDYLTVSAWFLYGAGWQTVAFIMDSKPGMGEHQWNIRVREIIPFVYYTIIASILYGFVVLQLKTAIIIQFVRILVPYGVRNAVYWIFHALLWINILLYIITTFLEIFLCNPRAKAWDPTIKEGHCMDTISIFVVTAAINAASDLTLVVVPQLIIWKLNMPTRKKWAVSVVFLVGLLASSAAIARLYYSIIMYHNEDFTWTLTLMGIFGMTEMSCGFLVASLPVFPRFFKHQPVLLSMGTSLRSFFRKRNSSSMRRRSERLGSSDGSNPKKQTFRSDVEFDELVNRTDLSRLTTERPEREP